MITTSSFSLPTVGRIGLYVLLLLATIVSLYLARTVILPLLFALLLASVLGPAAMWLQEKLKIRWSLACVTVTIGVVLVNVILFFAFSTSITRFLSQMTEEKQIQTYHKVRKNLETIVHPFELDQAMFPRDPQSLRDIKVLQYITDSGPWIFQNVTIASAEWIWQVILILFVTFFVLLEGKMLARRVVAIFGPTAEVQARATEVLFEMAAQVRTYLVWRTLINVGLAVVVGLLFQAFGLHQAWTWAILLLVLNYIPYIGPVLACVPPFLDAFISTGHPSVPILIMILYWAIILVEGWLIVPLLMGHNMDLNATTVMLACLFWPLVFGPTGLFLAMPLMAAIKAVLSTLPDFQAWANLMSAGEPEPPQPVHTFTPSDSAHVLAVTPTTNGHIEPPLRFDPPPSKPNEAR